PPPAPTRHLRLGRPVLAWRCGRAETERCGCSSYLRTAFGCATAGVPIASPVGERSDKAGVRGARGAGERNGKGENMHGRNGVRQSPGAYAYAPLVALIAVATLLLSPAFAAAQGSNGRSSPLSRADDWSPPTTVYIPDTGQTINGVFLDFWRNNDGATN